MTVEDDQQAKAVDPQASLRAEMLGQIVAAQFELESAIADLARNGAPSTSIAEARTQFASLGALCQQLASADSKTLIALRATVAAAVASGQSAAQQALGDAGGAMNNQAMNAQQARQAIADVGRKLFEDKALDPYLQFASAEDEVAYRRREEERRKAYEAEMEKHTVEGDRRAAEIAKSQLGDAEAHGAGKSPEFQRMQASVQEASTTLSAIAAETPTPTKPSRSNAPNDDISDVMAALREAGVKTDEPPSAQPSHGLGSKMPSRDAGASVGRSS